MHNQEVNYCHYCKERWYGLPGEIDELSLFECRKCVSDINKTMMKTRACAIENDMDPKIDSMYHLLPHLSNIEEMFIARVYVVMKVYRLDKGRIGYKGNILNVEQDIQPVINKLPFLPSQMPIFICRKFNPNAPTGYEDFNINQQI